MKKIILKPLLLVVLLLTLCYCSEEVDFYSSSTETPIVGIDDNELELTGKKEASKIFIKSNFWWKASVIYPSAAEEEWIQLDSTRGYGNCNKKLEIQQNR